MPMESYDTQAAAHEVVVLMLAAKFAKDSYSGSVVATRLLDDAHSEFCKNTPQQRDDILKLWTNATPVTDGAHHLHGLLIKDMLLKTDCE